MSDRVKLAIDLKTKKQVAIKIMRVKNMVNKRECLDCLFREINILTECRHPNIIKILDASFDGMIIKEQRGVLGSGSGEADHAE